MMDKQERSAFTAALCNVVREYVTKTELKISTWVSGELKALSDLFDERIKQIPAGPQGERGEKGESIKGEKGDKGDSVDKADIDRWQTQLNDFGLTIQQLEPAIRERLALSLEKITIQLAGDAIGKLPKPKDGTDGKDGRDGREGKDGLNGKDGRDGVAGRDALQIDILPAIDVSKSLPRGTFAFGYGGTLRARTNTTPGHFDSNEWDVSANGFIDVSGKQSEDFRTFTFDFVMTNGVHKELSFYIPAMIYQDVYDRQKEYRRGDVVTFDNQAWHAQIDKPQGQPGVSKDWKLMVRKGANGKDGKGIQGPPGPAGRDGRDLTLAPHFDGNGMKP